MGITQSTQRDAARILQRVLKREVKLAIIGHRRVRVLSIEPATSVTSVIVSYLRNRLAQFDPSSSIISARFLRSF
ncbi:hypothetical protein [Hyphomicrobium sp. 1Nfss2.1]|uniref:hypothetical protein n=1 Tax=Hyphomicrobium sp. 1Nfss2.1 TaxID=3413936 RepID=UPI003C7E0ECF